MFIFIKNEMAISPNSENLINYDENNIKYFVDVFFSWRYFAEKLGRMCGARLRRDRPLFAPAALNGHPALRGLEYVPSGTGGKRVEKPNITPRRKLLPIQAYCLESERQLIESKAKIAGMSLSEYLRKCGMEGVVTSVLDQQAVATLAKVNANLGRVGGLLKALLTNDERFDGLNGQKLQDVTLKTVEEIRQLQTRMLHIVERITGK